VSRLAVVLATWTVLGFATGLLAAAVLPTALGYRSLTVLSGSMEPALSAGDLVLVRRISPLDARVGDIVSFRDPEDPSRLVTHRVRTIEVDGRQVRFETKGDSNTTIETWGIDAGGTIGRVEFDLPLAGYALSWLASPLAKMALVVIPALMLGSLEIARIWWRRPEEARSDDEVMPDAA
jgi:signal peptidase